MFSLKASHLNGYTFRFRLQENELSSVITQTAPLERTHQFSVATPLGFVYIVSTN